METVPKKQVGTVLGTLYLHVRRAAEIVNFPHSKLFDLTIAISENSKMYINQILGTGIGLLSYELDWTFDYINR
jgi:hypothetical protein